MYWQFIVMLVLAIIAIAMAPRPQTQNATATGLDEIDFPTADRNRSLPVVFGKLEIRGPNNIWAGDFGTIEIIASVDGGMFHSDTEYTTGYRYQIGMQMALCYGTVDEFTKFRMDDKVAWSGSVTTNANFVVDKPFMFGGPDDQGGVYATCQFYNGSMAQNANSYLAGQVSSYLPAYRGVSYFLWKGKSAGGGRSGEIGNSATLKAWKFTVRRNPNTLGLLGNKHIIGNGDANPACCLYEILTNEQWGMGLTTGLIDTASFTAAGNTLFDEGFGIAFLWNSESAIKTIVEDIMRHIDASLVFDFETGLLRLKLIRLDYIEDDLKVFDDSNISDISNYTRGAWRGTVNEVVVSYLNSAANYVPNTVSANDTANAFVQNRFVTQGADFHMVTTGTLATKLAWRELKAMSLPLAKFELEVNRFGYNILVGDAVKVSSTKLGIVGMLCRVVEASYGTHASGKITLSVIEDIFAVQNSVYAPPPPTDSPPLTIPPAPIVYKYVKTAPQSFNTRTEITETDVMYFAARPSTGHRAYHKAENIGASSPLLESGDIVFTPLGFLSSDMGKYDDTSVDVTGIDLYKMVSYPQNLVELGFNIAFIEDGNASEWISFLNVATGDDINYTISTLERGLIDTPARAHAAGTKVWFCSYGYGRNVVITDTKLLYYKILPATPQGVLAEGLATLFNITGDNRAELPYPLREVKIASDGSERMKAFPAGGTLAVSAVANSYKLTTGLDLVGKPVSEATVHNWWVLNGLHWKNNSTGIDSSVIYPVITSGTRSLIAGQASGLSVNLLFSDILAYHNQTNRYADGIGACPPTVVVFSVQTVNALSQKSVGISSTVMALHTPYEEYRPEVNQKEYPKGDLLSLNGELISIWVKDDA